MGKLKKMTIVGVAAGVAALGGIVGTVSASAGAAEADATQAAAPPPASDLKCDYWWDDNTFGAKCKTDFIAYARCKKSGDVQSSGWISPGKTAYIYCWDKGGYKAESGYAFAK